MDSRTEVVTVFLRCRSRILLVKRSQRVGSYRGLWAGISGYRETNPLDDARREVREETGLDSRNLELVAAGTPLQVDDRSRSWTVHPFLFDVDTDVVRLDWEAEGGEWVTPPAILERETVPGLWQAWRAVAADPTTIRNDRTHGADWIATRAVELLRDVACENTIVVRPDSPGRLQVLARELAQVRPGMPVIANRVDQVAWQGGDHPAAWVEEADRLLSGDALTQLVEVTRAALPGRRILTLSRSSTVEAALVGSSPDLVAVAACDPPGEGRGVADDLARTCPGSRVVLVADAAVPLALSRFAIDVVLVGADAILEDGSVLNRTGSTAAALAAAHRKIPFLVASLGDKLTTASGRELLVPEPATGRPESFAPMFEQIPADLITKTLVESGELSADQRRRRLETICLQRSWRDQPADST